MARIGLFLMAVNGLFYFTTHNSLNRRHKTTVNPDYLIDYPGFFDIYGIQCKIPSSNSEMWATYTIDTDGDLCSVAYKWSDYLKKLLMKIEAYKKADVVVIFIPKQFEQYTKLSFKDKKFDLHDCIKAFAVQKNISTQFLREETITSNLDCQIAWALSLAFYVKSLRTPWILSTTRDDTAFAGIGYSIDHAKKSNIVLGCSHIYSSNGQGMKYKLSKISDVTYDRKKNPYLSEDEAYKLGLSIKELFFRSFSEMPRRVVIHKRTEFKKNEINGLVNGLSGCGIEEIDLVEINYEDAARFYELNKYGEIDGFPVRRGACFAINAKEALLYTHGIAPSIKNPNYKYIQGGRSLPIPLKIKKHYGNGELGQIATEILGLSKMNWNSFELYSKLPCTIDSANVISRIGRYLDYFDGEIYDYRNFM